MTQPAAAPQPEKYICDYCGQGFDAPTHAAHSQAILVYKNKIALLDFCPDCTGRFFEAAEAEKKQRQQQPAPEKAPE